MSERAPHRNGSHDDDAHALMGERGYWHGYAYAYDHKRSAYNVVNAYALARSERLTRNGAYVGRERTRPQWPMRTRTYVVRSWTGNTRNA
jgi:hypothetical protein